MSEVLRQFNDLSSWREQTQIIKGGEVKEIDFTDTTPNMFIINNPNPATLKVSIDSIPRLNNYEFNVDKNSVKSFGKPTGTRKIYVFNTSASDVNIKLYSIKDTFDMNVVKDLIPSIEETTLKTDGVVKGFQAGVSLPAGNNTIGTVNVESQVKTALTSLNSRQATMLTALDTTKTKATNIESNTSDMLVDNDTIIDLLGDIKTNTSNIGSGSGSSGGSSVDLSTIETALANVETALDTIKTGVSDNLTQNTDINSKLLGIRNNTEYIGVTAIKLTNYVLGAPQDKTPVYGNNVTSFSYTAGAKETIHFNWFMNDGGLGTFSINDTQVFTVMANENLNELEFQLNSGDVLTFTATEPMFRYKYFVY